MKKIIAALIISLMPCSLANASIITLDFTASGFEVANGGATPPQEIVSGRLTWQGDSIMSGIQKLLSIDLTISGYTYALSDIEFYDYWGVAQNVGGKSSGIFGMVGGFNDFWLSWTTDNVNISPPQYFYPTYFTSTNAGIYPLDFAYTTESSPMGWSPQYLVLSFKESSVSEPSSFILLLAALFGFALRRKI